VAEIYSRGTKLDQVVALEGKFLFRMKINVKNIIASSEATYATEKNK
jgi:hypothetical protein